MKAAHRATFCAAVIATSWEHRATNQRDSLEEEANTSQRVQNERSQSRTQSFTGRVVISSTRSSFNGHGTTKFDVRHIMT